MSTFNKSFEYFYLRDKNSNKVIGWCGFHTWYVVHKRAEIGYVMTDESFRGQGMMTEAMARILKYGFETMHLHRVEAFVGKGNRASRNLLEHSGFKKEGLLKEHYFKEGVMEDSLLYALLQSEYETR